ncbi:MAG TPA: SIS domain-containing protein [Planctomycetaceae bacterium]|nr:SIS domain-containing protein [Planctomycetaceae bacterium]
MLGAQMDVQAYLARLQTEVARLDTRAIEALSDAIFERYHSGRFVYIIGNGGSAANASHLCEDLGKSTLVDFEHQKRLKVLSLTDNTPYILAWANDTRYDRIFVEQLKNFGEPGDLLIAISGSGNSPNILAAVEWANAHRIETFGLTGYDGGKLLNMARRSLHCRIDDMGMVESLHQVAFHYVLDDLHGRINGKKHKAAA